MVRSTGSASEDDYEQVGLRAATTLWNALDEYAETPVEDILDWGCGTGRVTRQLFARKINVHGCDVDSEAIDWANENVAPCFKVNGLDPPLPYDEGVFDAVVALSVMTHLDRNRQKEWLREIARVLRPNGTFIASVHGEAFARSCGVTDLSLFGIEDHYINIGLTGVIPDGYYRDVIQTEAYTRYRWQRHFDIIAYKETALELHDMVVLRKK